MSRAAEKALLPAGLRDILPPDAAFEAAAVERVMACFAAHGYERVKPPLIEFEDGLLAGPGAALASDTFRLMDPVSQRMMGVRADMTLQVARIAATRLKNLPRPLRLSYAGQVLRVTGSQLRPERQFGQAGVELIGAASAAADAEVALLAAEALATVGVGGVSLDLNLPTLTPAIAAALGFAGEAKTALVKALDRKDAAAVAGLAGRHGALFAGLLAAGGPARRALSRLARLDLPAEARAERDRLAEVVELVLAQAPELAVTVDPVEHRGFEYHSGISFTLFARRVRGELGRGGRYSAASGESSTGFTLYMDTLLRALPAPETDRRLFLPAGTPRARGQELRRKGWITVAGFDAAADTMAEAKRQRCSHVFVGRKIVALEE
jgi:ATP phosphoribosyltransferase regulatory subunit